MRKSKNYVEASKKIDRNKLYTLTEAVSLLKETKYTKFDASVDICFHLNLNTTKVDQQLRGAVVLPNGTGKTKKVLVLTKGANAEAAKAAGADFVGEMDYIQKIAEENWFEFDIVVATPDMMPSLSKIAKILGPKGLMPSPKTGTVTTDVAKALEEIKKGRIEYRTDSYGNIHTIIGKVSFEEANLVENARFIKDLLTKLKPATVKGGYIKSVTLSSTMGPGIKIIPESFDIK